MRLAIVALTVVALDLVTKAIAVASWADAPRDLGWITLRVGTNTGVGFSLGEGLAPAVVLVLTSLLAAAFVVLALRGHLGGALTAGLLVGGALGNVIDRIGDGAVVDWLDLGWWPAFNVADAALTVGIAGLLLSALRDGRRDGPEAA